MTQPDRSPGMRQSRKPTTFHSASFPLCFQRHRAATSFALLFHSRPTESVELYRSGCGEFGRQYAAETSRIARFNWSAMRAVRITEMPSIQEHSTKRLRARTAVSLSESPAEAAGKNTSNARCIQLTRSVGMERRQACCIHHSKGREHSLSSWTRSLPLSRLSPNHNCDHGA
jgi:hypothetical protein